MKIKVITPPPVVSPPPTIEVTLNEAEARFVHKILGVFSYESRVV